MARAKAQLDGSPGAYVARPHGTEFERRGPHGDTDPDETFADVLHRIVRGGQRLPGLLADLLAGRGCPTIHPISAMYGQRSAHPGADL